MTESFHLICPHCHNNDFVVKYEASHVYTYIVDKDAPGLKNADEFLSFRYDNRELKESKQYIECKSCKSKFPCSFNHWNQNTSFKELQEVINRQ